MEENSDWGKKSGNLPSEKGIPCIYYEMHQPTSLATQNYIL